MYLRWLMKLEHPLPTQTSHFLPYFFKRKLRVRTFSLQYEVDQIKNLCYTLYDIHNMIMKCEMVMKFEQ